VLLLDVIPWRREEEESTAARKSLSKSFMRKRSRRVRGVHTYTHTLYVLCRKLLSIHGFLGENEEDPLSLSHCRAHIFSPPYSFVYISRLPFAHSPIVPLNRELIDEGFRFLFFFFFFCFFFNIIFSCCPPRLNTNGNVKIKMISEGREPREKGKKRTEKKKEYLAVKSHHTHTQTI
jgi:hypothetical protein